MKSFADRKMERKKISKKFVLVAFILQYHVQSAAFCQLEMDLQQLWRQVPRPLIPSPSSNAYPKVLHASQTLRFVPSGLFCQVSAFRKQLMSNGYRHTWAWRAIQQQTEKPSEGARCHSQLYLWTSHLLPWPLSGINRASLRIGTSAIHMPGSIEYSQAASTVTSVGNGIGPGTSA